MTTQDEGTLRSRIEASFAHRQIPECAVDLAGRHQLDSDVEEGLWFSGRDWRNLRWTDWQEHPAAITYFSKEAFAYFLPSVLILSLDNPSEVLDAAESLIWDLDRSPSIQGWDESFRRRLLGLYSREYEALKEWLLQICEYPPYRGWGTSASGPGDVFGRAYETTYLLQQESDRLGTPKEVRTEGTT